ncbi:Sec1 family protein [Metarhizium robertsii ARSEF 23]|uniref:Sec1 family protein n=1 Tax=Metarhizium robertsii (strain ARSEF 23 / ATCC MYA-3075) TaxID=655844 RepID=A0A0B2X7J3_METRA|nr:Sec1 family protein [Metarhizium robertsii ARSEF 23]KHO10893.1 Sec1 family protein [Metarhizium robertsii ARSEF 23]
MSGLRQLSWIDDRLREAFPNRNEEFFGGLNILLVGDLFQLPPVLQKPLYYEKEVQGVEINGRNAYRRFDKSVFLKVVQRQRGDELEAFRTALGELRLLQLSVESWKLLSSRVQAKLDDQEVARFANALRVYTTKDRVNEYNHYHLDRLSRPVIQVKAKNVGLGSAAAPDDKAGNLAKQTPMCIGARLMLTSNLWQPIGLYNGARASRFSLDIRAASSMRFCSSSVGILTKPPLLVMFAPRLMKLIYDCIESADGNSEVRPSHKTVHMQSGRHEGMHENGWTDVRFDKGLARRRDFGQYCNCSGRE